jgi:hypothetical protein
VTTCAGVGLAWLASGARPGARLVSDDLTPAGEWPPMFRGQVDTVRVHWLAHPDLDATELRLAPDLAALVATRRWPGP